MAEQKHASKRFAEKSSRVITYVLLGLISVIWVIPFVYLIFQSFSNSINPSSFFPTSWTLENYAKLFTDKDSTPFFNWWINTFVIALFTAALQTILVLMTSYA